MVISSVSVTVWTLWSVTIVSLVSSVSLWTALTIVITVASVIIISLTTIIILRTVLRILCIDIFSWSLYLYFFNRFLRLFRCWFCLSLCLQLCCFCRCKMLCLFRCFCCLRVNCAFKCFSYIITGCRSCLRIAAVWILSLWTAVAIPLASVTISRTSVVIAAAAASLFAVLCIEHSSNA